MANDRLEFLKRQLQARQNNPGMARSCAMIREQIAAIEAAAQRAQEAQDGDKADG